MYLSLARTSASHCQHRRFLHFSLKSPLKRERASRKKSEDSGFRSRSCFRSVFQFRSDSQRGILSLLFTSLRTSGLELWELLVHYDVTGNRHRFSPKTNFSPVISLTLYHPKAMNIGVPLWFLFTATHSHSHSHLVVVGKRVVASPTRKRDVSE